MLVWVSSQSRNFGPGFDLHIIDIVDVNQFILDIWFPRKGHLPEFGKRFQRKTRLILVLKDIMIEINIRYELPAQIITQRVHTVEPHPTPLFGQRVEVSSQTFSAHVIFSPTTNNASSGPKEA